MEPKAASRASECLSSSMALRTAGPCRPCGQHSAYHHRLEPHRVDVVVELAYTLYLSAMIAVLEERENAGQAECEEIVDVLTPFEGADLLTARGHSILAWAREEDND